MLQIRCENSMLQKKDGNILGGASPTHNSCSLNPSISILQNRLIESSANELLEQVSIFCVLLLRIFYIFETILNVTTLGWEWCGCQSKNNGDNRDLIRYPQSD